MTEIQGKVAFITGGASGIGLALAKTLMSRGARVAIADTDEHALAAVQSEFGSQATAILCDVANLSSVEQAAATTLSAYGEVHLLFNNAGVGAGGVAGEISVEDWRWAIDVNLMGVVHGVETFVPIIQSQKTGGHIINTASIAGHIAAPYMSPYSATKFAVVGYSECLKLELAMHNIGVSVLSPAFVRTNIHNSGANRPSADKEAAGDEPDTFKTLVESGLDPAVVADWTADSIEANRFHIFTHPELMTAVEDRMNDLLSDYAASAANDRFAA
ncbi:MAG: SDR family NAD(P)-dependent oxidoreductase [Parasphingorhabdus sp.]|uniref:SDR family NAD(P)-dependent oxidoreductase n=1 Tax=Parasphingorhabdus sp. TaxID=2709688 RepID=UPI0032979E10